ncbi:MAG: sulfur carrier protein ThiS [Sedimentisphaerales bacterium]|jgi:thiamine biosynthesis protein ThiS|nr:sulfur carrier protein ThiS [Sedimentisphaerales bacterium]
MAMLKINGVERTFSDPLPRTLAELLQLLGVDAATVVAEIDGQIVRKESFGVTPLRDGQSIELVRFVGGG